MSVLTASNLAKSFGPDEIFSGISLEIPQRARIALVGVNGAGKTTLMHILIGQDPPTLGSVQMARNVRIGFLPQRPELLGEHSLWEEALRAFEGLRAREAQLLQLEDAMASGDESVLARYGELQEQFELDGGYTYTQRIKAVLVGLGFDEDEFEVPLTRLSGGQKTRAVLARLLLEAPDLLALDEPTNHLDINAVEWLEGYLKDFSGAVLAISHDRYFIDAFATNIWEMEAGRMDTYRANYTQYLQQRDERRALQQKEFESQQAFIAKQEDYIRRNIAGQNTRQAKGRRRRLDRLKRDSLLQAPNAERDKMRVQLEITHRGNAHVFSTEALAVGYADADAPLLQVDDIQLERGEIAALIGPNGVGKSTFIKTVIGQLAPYSGEVIVGDKMEVGYFAQAHEMLNPNNTVIDEIIEARRMSPAEARGYLAPYLFRGDEVFRKISTLSGGERGRVALAKLALGTANLLLLDEPTNHLDIASQEVLEDMLMDYSGTVLLVSHDRYLVDAVATQIWAAIPPVDGAVTGHVDVFKGSYTEYVQKREAERQAKLEAEARAREAQKQAASGLKAGGTASATPSKKHGLNPFQLKKRIEELEAQIEQLESKLARLHDDIEAASAKGNADDIYRLSNVYTETEATLSAALEAWGALVE